MPGDNLNGTVVCLGACPECIAALANKFILIVDDWNWNQVRKGTIDAIKDENLKIVAKLEIRTTIDDSSSLITGQNSDWHQGCAFFVLEK